MNIKKTTEYFKKTLDELLTVRNEYGYTREENLLFDSGAEIVFFDNENEMKQEQAEFEEYIKSRGYEVKDTVQTINERIAVILI